MTIFRWILAVAVIGLVALAGVKSLKPRTAPPMEVELARATKASLTRTVSGAGKLEPVKKINVSSNITGVLVDLAVGIGSEVKKGQYLGQIDTSQYRASVDSQSAQAEAAWADVQREDANLVRLRSEEARVRRLVESRAANASELEQASANVHMAEAQIRANRGRARSLTANERDAKNRLGWATLKSPVTGTVFGANHRVGERIRGSDFSEDVVLVIGTLDRMDVRIEVSEHDVVHLKPGQKANIEVDALPDQTIEGEVLDSARDATVKNPGTDNEVTSYPVWIRLDKVPASALPGMSAQVTIFTQTKSDVVAVPIQAVTVRAPMGERGDKAGGDKAGGDRSQGDRGGPGPGGLGKMEKVVFVYVAGSPGKIEQRVVKTGLQSDRMVEITSGLKAGEELVEGPYRVLARELQDGQQVEPRRPEGADAPGKGAGPASARAGHP